jgi:hypothetical protein
MTHVSQKYTHIVKENIKLHDFPCVTQFATQPNQTKPKAQFQVKSDVIILKFVMLPDMALCLP